MFSDPTPVRYPVRHPQRFSEDGAWICSRCSRVWGPRAIACDPCNSNVTKGVSDEHEALANLYVTLMGDVASGDAALPSVKLSNALQKAKILLERN